MSQQNESVIKALNLFVSENSFDQNEDIHKKYLDRIRSYIVGQKWVTKPLVLSPAVCAQYGWKCISSNCLECSTCGAKLCPGDPKIESYESYKSCIRKVLQDLKKVHKKHCPWPLTPCPENFVHMVPLQKEEAFEQFTKRVKLLLSVGTFLPIVKKTFAEVVEMTDQHIISLFKMVEIDTTNSTLENRYAALLACTGWTSETENCKSTRHIMCNDCQRSIALISFSTINSILTDKSTDNQDSDTSNTTKFQTDSDVEPPKKKQCLTLKREYFDPLYEHRPWCLWININNSNKLCNTKGNSNVKKENSLGDAQGWKIFLNCLLRNVDESTYTSSPITSPSKEQLRTARNLINTWADA